MMQIGGWRRVGRVAPRPAGRGSPFRRAKHAGRGLSTKPIQRHNETYSGNVQFRIPAKYTQVVIAVV